MIHTPRVVWCRGVQRGLNGRSSLAPHSEDRAMSNSESTRESHVLHLGAFVVALIIALAGGLGAMSLSGDPSAAAEALGPTLCSPETEAVVAEAAGYDERGKWKKDATYALHCVSRDGQEERTYGALFLLLWGVRFIPQAALIVGVLLPLFIFARYLRQAFARRPPAPAAAPTQKPRRRRRR